MMSHEEMSAHEPMTPEDCDLRDFAFMPLDIVRLFGSRFHAIASDSEWRAGITLWLKSFHQVPAASLPNDDVELCRLAELGRDIKEWRKIKEIALHGWVLCADGRLYHPVVAEKANEAWQRKMVQRERSRKGNAKRWGHGDHHADEHALAQGARSKQEDHPFNDDKQSKKESLKESLSESLKESLKESPKESLKDRKGQGQGQGYIGEPNGSPRASAREVPAAAENLHDDPPPGNQKTKSKPNCLTVSAEQMQADLPGLSATVASDYLAARRSLKAALTPSAWKLIADEVRKSGWVPDDALSEAMAAGWRGFKAQWLANRTAMPQGRTGRSAVGIDDIGEHNRRVVAEFFANRQADQQPATQQGALQ